jgi:hypothetical protein
MPSRIVIVHNHLFKNAGSTIDWALEKNFGGDFLDHRNDIQMRQGAIYLSNYLEHNQHIKALSTHHLTLPLPSLPRTHLLQLVMFRHPIERVISVYGFEKKQEISISQGARQARNNLLSEYIVWRMQPDTGPVIRNFQARRTLQINGCTKGNPTSQFTQNAKRFARGIELPGLVDRFDESMVLFEESLTKMFPKIDLSYVKQNIGQEVTASIELRLQKLKIEIGEEIYRMIVDNNLYDLQLLKIVRDEFEIRVSRVPGFSEKLLNFRKRCITRSIAFHGH